ncbi:class I SAM-dependent methyltransferase [Acidothermaceae bacterium B102]|nr:class I SAM-dependent methyltransferase [Acidothermaceae bacterium B102]
MDRTRQGYDRVAEQYAAQVGGELAGKPLDRSLLEAFVVSCDGGLIADIGCGPGHVAAYLAAAEAQVVGLDLSPQMCAVGRRATSLPFVAGDMTALPLTSSVVAGVVCWYAVIHLDGAGRLAAYREMARVLRPGGQALIAFHTGDSAVPMGGAVVLSEFMGQPVDLTFRYLDPAAETEVLASAGLALVQRWDRDPYPEVEHASQRSYLLATR